MPWGQWKGVLVLPGCPQPLVGQLDGAGETQSCPPAPPGAIGGVPLVIPRRLKLIAGNGGG